jgi:hypothetical protein
MPSTRQRDSTILAVLALAMSAVSFLHYFSHHEILLYGDAVAHMHIARRVLDSLTPGPLQLGTVWLPLPHILMIPCLVSDWMWRSGAGGSIPSMAAYVVGTLGIFRLLQDGLASRPAAWFGAAIYAANPNLVYLQSTAMTEPLYSALFIWTVVFVAEFARKVRSDPHRAAATLERVGILLAAAMLARYDGWFLAAFVVPVVLALLRSSRYQPEHKRLRRAARNLVLLTVSVAALWLAYNLREFGNPLEFAMGQYSARSIAERTSSGVPHPGEGSPWVAALYFLKCARLNLGEAPLGWQLGWAGAGTLMVLVAARHFASWLLLWIPLPFYSLSIAYGGTPVFLPVWWPFSYYNLRYGLQLLPAVAAFIAFAFGLMWRAGSSRRWWRALAIAPVLAMVLSYVSTWQGPPICLREARVNSATRIPFESKLATELSRLPATAILLMYTGAHPGVLQQAGVPLRQVVNESNHPQWEQALDAPAHEADYVIAIEGDQVARAVAERPQGLEPVAVIESAGQPRTTVYKSHRRAAPPGPG